MLPQNELEPLNAREVEILALIAGGLTNREIAERLYLSLETVKWYNKQIFAKLGAASRTQAVSIARRNGQLATAPLPATAAIGKPDRYRLGDELGRGGMGIVYQAEDSLLNRAVAVKLLSGEITEEARSRLLQEARAAASLSHPNIVSIFDAGEMNGMPYIVMELVTGPSLYEARPETMDQIIDVAGQICAGLEHAHAQGIIHRDLKPENIILTASGRVKIVDFGLARSIASRISSQNLIAGSVYYLAPEQALGQDVDGRADLYSLGVILYELVAGQLPFSGDDPLNVISQHLYAPVVAPSTYQAGAAPLEPVILRLLAKNPGERFGSAAEVMAALESARVAAERAELEAPDGGPAGAVKLLNRLARGRMVGRRGEIAQLQELWAQARQGQGHMALISGEPGIGKTRLANELIVYAQLAGAIILRGGCYEYEAATPYLPFMEALREWVHTQPPDAIRSQMGDTASELARLAPEIESKLGPQSPNPPLPAGEERLRLFDNVTRFLQSLSRTSGLMLFIDDLHWADQGTLSLLTYALRNLRGERVLILAAYREVELDRKHPLAAALVEWNRERIATRVSLQRFTFEETSALLATLFGKEDISDELTRAMYDETEGNPFFIEEVVKALIEQGQIYRENNKWERKAISELAIPQSVKEAIGRRLNRLSETCLNVLHAAAALGKEFDYAELAAVRLASEDQLLDALDEASTAQLLRAKSSETFAFTHDKIREVLYEEINPIRRKRLHQRIGEALEERFLQGDPAYIQDLAYHFMESGDLKRSLKYSVLAAEKASRLFALDESLSYYETAHEAAESLNLTGQVAAIHKAIGEIHSQRGQVHQAVHYFQCAINLEENLEERGAIKARMGSVYTSVGDARGLTVIEEALQELNPDTQAADVALATAMIGRYYHYRGLHGKAIEYIERALRIAEPLDHADTLSQIYAYLAGAYQHLTRFTESTDWAWKNIELGRRTNNPISEAYGYEFLAEDAYSVGNWQAAEAYAEKDREIGKKIGAQDRVAWAIYCQGTAKFGMGHVAEAESKARSARELSVTIGDMRLAVLSGGLLVQALADLGQEQEAFELGEQILADADALQHVYLQVNTRHCLAYAHLLHDQKERALDLYTQVEQLLEPTESLVTAMAHRSWLAQIYLDCGRADEAAGMAENARQLSRNAGARQNEAVAQRVQAQLSAAAGDWPAAWGAIKDSISTLEETGTRLELGRSIYTRGQLQRQFGEPQAAASDWAKAVEVFLSLGAVHAARQAQAQIEAMAE